MDEYIEFISMMLDFEKSILYYINLGEVDVALEKMEWFLGCSNDEFTLKLLINNFSNYSHIFLKKIQKNNFYFTK